MKKFFFFLFLLCVGMLFNAGCSKDEITYPYTLSGGQLVPIGPVRVYTEGGREIEGAEAQAFLERKRPYYDWNEVPPGFPIDDLSPGGGPFQDPTDWIE